MESSFRLLRVRGIDIGANWSWLFIFALIIFMLSASLFPANYPGHSTATYWTMGVIAGVLFFTSLLLHELGHAFRALKEGMEIDGITLWLFGGVARFKGMFPTAGAEFRIAIAGPLVTVALAAGFGMAWFGLDAAGAPGPVVGVPNYLWQINVLLLVFNMVPALPLDGGRVLRSALWQRKGSFTAATVSAARVGRVLAGSMIAFGIFGFLVGAPQGLWLAVIGWFILQAGQAELAYALFRQTLGGVRVRDLMTPDPETVDPSRSIASFIDEVAHIRGHSTYPVVDGFGGLRGMISLRQAAQVPVEQRPTTLVGEVMIARDSLPVVEPDSDITQAAPVLQGGPGRAVVMRDGRIAGILSMSDVARAVELEQVRSAEPTVAGRSRGPRRLLWVLVIVGGLGLLGAWYAPPFVVVAPGTAFDVTGDITIDDRTVDDVNGAYMLTSVAVRQPNVFGLMAAVFEGRNITSLRQVVPPDVDPEEFFEQQRALFQETQMIAAGAAARAAGLEVDIRGTGAVVSGVQPGTPADGVFEVGDVIVRIDGRTIELADDVQQAIRTRPAGTSFSVVVERGDAQQTLQVTSRGGVAEGAPGIGVLIQTRDFSVDLPFEISFRERQIGGPSAGLAYALAVYDLLETDDVARGRAVATTGTIDLEGVVGPVGGVDDKAVAARDAGADLFFVPSQEVQLADGADLQVVGVASLEEAIASLRAD